MLLLSNTANSVLMESLYHKHAGVKFIFHDMMIVSSGLSMLTAMSQIPVWVMSTRPQGKLKQKRQIE